MTEYIEIKNARVNNLKNVSLKIPRGKFVVITGVSGSGKSSLAFDTLYAEGQRRYVESLSSYARQFMGRMKKPECDYIKGLPPAIAIEQKTISRNPRSTVGTSTEIYEYLRLLFARIGKTISPISGEEVKKHTVEDVLKYALSYPAGTKILIEAPIDKSRGFSIFNTLKQEGFTRVEVDDDVDHIRRIDELTESDIEGKDVWLVVDRLSVEEEPSIDWLSRFTDSCETAFYEGHGECRIGEHLFSNRFECDGISFEEPNENMFSFNSPLGACSHCEGFGKIIGIDEHLVVPDTSLSIYDGAVVCWRGEKMSEWKNEFIRRAAQVEFPIFTPYYKLTQEEKDILWHGPAGTSPESGYDEATWFPSIDRFFQFVKENQYKIQYRVMLARFRGKTVCPVCHGARLKPEASYVKVGGYSITELVQMPISKLIEFFNTLELDDTDATIAKRLLIEIKNRLHFLDEVGLGYLTLNRPSNTLSGGESQRINLTTSLGSSLVGSLYILDEPSIGLHSRDTQRLIKVIRELVNIGNTVIVVEHDEEIMRAADYIIDVGPDAGSNGGEIVFEGNLSSSTLLKERGKSHTLDFLLSKSLSPALASRADLVSELKALREGVKGRCWNQFISLSGVATNNLKHIDIQVPLNVMTVVTGVSGSGKSSLIKGTLYPVLKRSMGEPMDFFGEYSTLGGDYASIKRVEFVDQNPIGKSTRSNAATYVKAYDAIRDLFASQQLAKQMGFTPQYFSFNAEGGRCEECKGAGIITVEMQFMADITLECEACHGHRFKKDVLDVTYHGKNIDDVLNMTISEAIEFFKDESIIVKRLKPLEDVGLGYIKLGQSSSTLSGGENQRVKLAFFIGQESAEPTLFIFDEPTTGLHFYDIQKLLASLNALIERGHTILIIEHNMEIIKAADYIIDLGPEGGDEGGYVIATGTPEEISKCAQSYTGKFLIK